MVEVTIEFNPHIGRKTLGSFHHLAYGSIPAGAVEAYVLLEGLSGLEETKGGLYGEVSDAEQVKYDLLEEVIYKVLQKNGDLLRSKYYMNRTFIDGEECLIAWAIVTPN